MSAPRLQRSLDYDELHARLVAHVDMVLTVRRSVEGTALELAERSRSEQERFLSALELIRGTSTELAFNFCMFGIGGLGKLDGPAWEHWVLHVMDRYDQGGVLAAIVCMQKLDEYIRQVRAERTGVRLADIRRQLEAFVTGLNGRPLKLEADAVGPPHTDTEHLFLPVLIDFMDRPAANELLYTATAVHLWAQTWFGTWRRSVAQTCAQYTDPERATRIFHLLETIRLDSCIERELPGLSRRLQKALGNRPLPSREWRAAAVRLRQSTATVDESFELLQQLYPREPTPPPAPYQGVLRPRQTEAVIAARMAHDKSALAAALDELASKAVPGENKGLSATGSAQSEDDERRDPFTIAAFDEERAQDGMHFALRLWGEPLEAPPDVRQLMDSIVQDIGEIPQEYLVAAGSGAYRSCAAPPKQAPAGLHAFDESHAYDEWDFARRHYRKDWCLLHERDIHPLQDGFVDRTLEKHRGLLKHLYRTFEALRAQNRRMRRQPHGDDIDIDAVVEAYADHSVGLEVTDRLFTQIERADRDIAVMFLVDMSGSTKGWINEVLRESLALLCESLETLGDRYAIYGFSGYTHKRCELFRIKTIDDPYDEAVRARISGVTARDYTRLGVFIRHATRILTAIEARTRLLITLSDGRPDDQDGYRGEYGIEDTRQALFEARCRGIHPFCITVDDEAMDYLPHMYGPVGFALVDHVEKLPLKVSEIYRKITYR